MLRALTIFAVVILSVAQAPVPASGQAADAGATNTQRPEKSTNDRENPPLAPPAVPPKDRYTPALKADTEQKKPTDAQQSVAVSKFPPVTVTIEKDGFDWSTFANYLLIVVGIAGVTAAICTLKVIERQVAEMKAQTALAQTSANAALKSAQALINSERGRLFESATATADFLVTVTAINYGRSPVQLIYGFVDFEILDMGESIFDDPQYRERWNVRDARYARSEWVMPEKEVFIGSLFLNGIISKSERTRIAAGDAVVWFYGKFQYREPISGEEEAPTPFVYMCIWRGHGNPPGLIGGGRDRLAGIPEARQNPN